MEDFLVLYFVPCSHKDAAKNERRTGFRDYAHLYAGCKFLAASIESVLGQTFRHLELLITDDHSSDPVSLQMLEDFARKDSRVDIVFLDTNHGPGYARNCSIERAKGRYIAFCDSDDRWTKDKLEKQLAFMHEKDCALSCSSYILLDEGQETKGIVIPPRSSPTA